MGILKKKHVGVHKDLEEQKSGLHSMQVPENQFQNTCGKLKRDLYN